MSRNLGQEYGAAVRNHDDYGAMLFHHTDGGPLDFAEGTRPNYIRAQNNLHIEPDTAHPYITNLKGDVVGEKIRSNSERENDMDTANVYMQPLITTYEVRNEIVNHEEDLEKSILDKLIGRQPVKEHETEIKHLKDDHDPLKEHVANTSEDNPAYMTAVDVKNPVSGGPRPPSTDPIVVTVGPKGGADEVYEFLSNNPQEHREFFQSLFPEEQYENSNEFILEDAQNPEQVRNSTIDVNLPKTYTKEIERF